MTVSIIIPCFNAARWIRETLDSIAHQSVDSETIVVDDGSTDESAAIISNEFPWVQLIRTTNLGASEARNTGTRAASGEFIQYLDADDLLTPGKIRLQVRALQETGADVAYGDWQKLVAGQDSRFLPGDVVAREMRCAPEIELFGEFWCPPAAYLFRRSIVDRVGGWSHTLPIIQDVRFALDCALQGGRFVYSPGVMAMYRMHGNESLSRRDPAAFVRDVYRNACEMEQWWQEHGGLSKDRKNAIVSCFGYVARSSFEQDRATFDLAYGALMRLSGRYIPAGPPRLAVASRLLGYPRAEAVATAYRRLKNALRGRLGVNY